MRDKKRPPRSREEQQKLLGPHWRDSPEATAKDAARLLTRRAFWSEDGAFSEEKREKLRALAAYDDVAPEAIEELLREAENAAQYYLHGLTSAADARKKLKAFMVAAADFRDAWRFLGSDMQGHLLQAGRLPPEARDIDGVVFSAELAAGNALRSLSADKGHRPEAEALILALRDAWQRRLGRDPRPANNKESLPCFQQFVAEVFSPATVSVSTVNRVLQKKTVPKGSKNKKI